MRLNLKFSGTPNVQLKFFLSENNVYSNYNNFKIMYNNLWCTTYCDIRLQKHFPTNKWFSDSMIQKLSDVFVRVWLRILDLDDCQTSFLLDLIYGLNKFKID